MKLKTKLIATISAFCLICVMLVVGIWALKNTSFNIGGKIDFTASGVNATVSAGVLEKGTHKTSSDATSKLKEFNILINDDQQDITDKSESWRDLSLLFNEDGEDVTITFSITNNNTAVDKFLNVAVDVKQGTPTNAEVSIDPTSASIAPTKSQEFVVTFHIENTDKDASLDGFELDFTLTHDKKIITNIDDKLYLSYNILNDTEAQINLVAAQFVNLEKIEVPEILTVSGKNYNVTVVGANYENAILGTNEFVGDLILPSTLELIDSSLEAPFICPSNIVCYATTPPTNNAPHYISAPAKIYVPSESLSVYEEADGWGICMGTEQTIYPIEYYEAVDVSTLPVSYTVSGNEAALTIEGEDHEEMWSTFDGVIPEMIKVSDGNGGFNYYTVTSIDGYTWNTINFVVLELPSTIKTVGSNFLSYPGVRPAMILFKSIEVPEFKCSALYEYAYGEENPDILVPQESLEEYASLSVFSGLDVYAIESANSIENLPFTYTSGTLTFITDANDSRWANFDGNIPEKLLFENDGVYTVGTITSIGGDYLGNTINEIIISESVTNIEEGFLANSTAITILTFESGLIFGGPPVLEVIPSSVYNYVKTIYMPQDYIEYFESEGGLPAGVEFLPIESRA